MKRRTGILVPLFERAFKTNKTFTKRTIMLKLQKIAPELEVTDDEIRNTINILMQRGTIERDYDKKKGDSKGAVYRVVDKRIIDVTRQLDVMLDEVRAICIDVLKTSFDAVKKWGLLTVVVHILITKIPDPAIE